MCNSAYGVFDGENSHHRFQVRLGLHTAEVSLRAVRISVMIMLMTRTRSVGFCQGVQGRHRTPSQGGGGGGVHRNFAQENTKKFADSRPVAPTLEVGWPWGTGAFPGEKFQKLKPIASISGHLVPFQCNYNERLFDSATSQEDAMIDRGQEFFIILPLEKFQKLKAIARIFRHLVPFQCN